MDNFLELAVSDFDGKPTTLCRLDKAVWEKSKKVTKELQVKFFTEMNYIGPVHDSTDLANSIEIERHTDGAVVLGLKNPQAMYIPSNLGKYVNANEQGASEMSEGNEDEIISEDYIIQYLPSEVISALDDDSIQALKQISCAIQNTQVTEDNKKDSIGDVYTISMDVMHDALKSSSQSSARKLKWQQNTSVQLSAMLSCADTINQNFTSKESQIILSLSKRKLKSNHKKSVYVNEISKLYGDGTVMPD